jgi:hypothetical protein
MKPMTPLETKLLAELTRLQARLYRAENALRALGYEPHGIGWAIQVANPIPHEQTTSSLNLGPMTEDESDALAQSRYEEWAKMRPCTPSDNPDEEWAYLAGYRQALADNEYAISMPILLEKYFKTRPSERIAFNWQSTTPATPHPSLPPTAPIPPPPGN